MILQPEALIYRVVPVVRRMGDVEVDQIPSVNEARRVGRMVASNATRTSHHSLTLPAPILLEIKKSLSELVTNAEMVFDPTPIEPDKTLFERQDWSYSAYGYESLKEELPSDMPVPHGQSMTMRVFVDADHAGDQVTR